MRLALVLDRFDPDRGGLEHWAWQWTQWLLDRGHEVSVIAAEARGGPVRERFSVHTLGGAPGAAESRFAFAARVADFLPRAHADVVHDLGVGWRCDILQPQFGTRLADDRRALASLPFGRRVAARLSSRRRARLSDIRRLERRQYAEGGPHVVAVSRMTRADLSAAHAIPASRVSVIHNGVDPARYPPADPAARASARRGLGLDGGLLLLFVGHNFRLKGLDTVLRAMARLRRADLRLFVVGRGPVAAYERLARKLGLASQVAFSGWLPEIRTAYAAADAFVQPTFYDPCSLVALEAAASGLPVLTSRFNGAAELFRDGESAWILADSADDRAAADRIEAWFNPACRRAMARAALAVARSATHDRCFTELLALCRRTIQSRRAA